MAGPSKVAYHLSFQSRPSSVFLIRLSSSVFPKSPLVRLSKVIRLELHLSGASLPRTQTRLFSPTHPLPASASTHIHAYAHARTHAPTHQPAKLVHIQLILVRARRHGNILDASNRTHIHPYIHRTRSLRLRVSPQASSPSPREASIRARCWRAAASTAGAGTATGSWGRATRPRDTRRRG